jgi:hypothetical protein
LGVGRKSGRSPLVQQACCIGFNVEQKLLPGLYLVKS